MIRSFCQKSRKVATCSLTNAILGEKIRFSENKASRLLVFTDNPHFATDNFSCLFYNEIKRVFRLFTYFSHFSENVVFLTKGVFGAQNPVLHSAAPAVSSHYSQWWNKPQPGSPSICRKLGDGAEPNSSVFHVFASKCCSDTKSVVSRV